MTMTERMPRCVRVRELLRMVARWQRRSPFGWFWSERAILFRHRVL